MGGEGGRAWQPCEAGARIQPSDTGLPAHPSQSLESHIQDFGSK